MSIQKLAATLNQLSFRLRHEVFSSFHVNNENCTILGNISKTFICENTCEEIYILCHMPEILYNRYTSCFHS